VLELSQRREKSCHKWELADSVPERAKENPRSCSLAAAEIPKRFEKLGVELSDGIRCESPFR
jgi:hypothetical protein